MFLSDEIKICYFFEYQSNENQVFRFFLGTPSIFFLLFVSKISNQLKEQLRKAYREHETFTILLANSQ